MIRNTCNDYTRCGIIVTIFSPSKLKIMSPYSTLSGTMNELRKQGYVKDFNLQQNCLECHNGEFKLLDDEFKVDKFFRFEGESNPSDSAILYAISSDSRNVKGLLVNAYGIYSEPLADKMVKKLEMRKRIAPI